MLCCCVFPRNFTIAFTHRPTFTQFKKYNQQMLSSPLETSRGEDENCDDFQKIQTLPVMEGVSALHLALSGKAAVALVTGAGDGWCSVAVRGGAPVCFTAIARWAGHLYACGCSLRSFSLQLPCSWMRNVRSSRWTVHVCAGAIRHPSNVLLHMLNARIFFSGCDQRHIQTSTPSL